MTGEALTYVEIDIQYCALTYGVPPCMASLTSSPPTGTDKCFNGLATCQDLDNIDLETVTLRFAMPATYLPREIDALPYLNGVPEFSPAIVSLGENLGQRASLKVALTDHPHSDTGEGFDKYHAERDYNPYDQGTFWGKFRKRQPYLRGASLRWKSGFVGQTLDEMETRHFFIESFEGPNDDGIFSITAKDCLKFLDGDRAQAPILSNGFLVAPIDEVTTAAVLSPAGIGNVEYPVSFYANIGGNEICAVTRSGDILTLTRAQFNTAVASHDAQDRVQVCLHYDALSPAAIIANLLTDYTDTPIEYIDESTWETEVTTSLNRLYTALIAEPTPVNKLVSELIQQGPLAVWDDNVARKIRLQVLRGIPTEAALYDESNIIRNSFSVSDQPDKRVSQVWVYYGQIDPTKRVDDPDNYRSCITVMDQVAEESFGSPAILKIFARWIPQLGSTVADSLGDKVLSRYVTAPRKLTYEVFKQEAAAVPSLGDGYRFAWWNLQNPDGSQENVPIQIVRLNPTPFSWKVDAEEMLFSAAEQDLNNRQIVIDFNAFNVNLKDVHDSLYPPLQPSQTVTCTITSGVIVGSTSISLPAFDIGAWDGSPDITLNVLGRIEGKGGNGGKGGPGNTPGETGGIALLTREMIDLTDAAGQIWGGGGGGGGGNERPPWPGGGGGGGGGQIPGAGGAGGGTIGNPGSPGTTEAGAPGGVPVSAGGQGGHGGGPGLNGTAGTTDGSAGGVAGAAIDGISFITTVGSAGDRRGGQIN